MDEKLPIAQAGIIVPDSDIERESWHEAGHVAVAIALGLVVICVGETWVDGQPDSNPCTWLEPLFHTISPTPKGLQLFAGFVAEYIKLGTWSQNGQRTDYRMAVDAGCNKIHAGDWYVDEIVSILMDQDEFFTVIREAILQEMKSPTREPYIDGGKYRIWLNHGEVEALKEKHFKQQNSQFSVNKERKLVPMNATIHSTVIDIETSFVDNLDWGTLLSDLKVEQDRDGATSSSIVKDRVHTQVFRTTGGMTNDEITAILKKHNISAEVVKV